MFMLTRDFYLSSVTHVYSGVFDKQTDVAVDVVTFWYVRFRLYLWRYNIALKFYIDKSQFDIFLNEKNLPTPDVCCLFVKYVYISGWRFLMQIILCCASLFFLDELKLFNYWQNNCSRNWTIGPT